MAVQRIQACALATAVVPWTESLNVDEALFRHELVTLLENGYRHLYVFGTGGEGYAVDDQQFETVVRIFVDALRSAGAEPMVGIISLSLSTILRRIAWVRDTFGVKRFQISLPSWGALENNEVRTFFDAVLGRFEDCQFLHYNLLRTKRLVSPAEYGRIATDHPNLVATKNSTDSMARVRDLLAQAPTLQHFLNERGFLYGSLIGECGLLISMATLNFTQGLRYFEAGRGRDVATLVRLEGELHNIEQFFESTVSGGTVLIDGAYDKVLWRIHDPRFPLRLLPPYRSGQPHAAETLAAFLRERYPHWAP